MKKGNGNGKQGILNGWLLGNEKILLLSLWEIKWLFGAKKTGIENYLYLDLKESKIRVLEDWEWEIKIHHWLTFGKWKIKFDSFLEIENEIFSLPGFWEIKNKILGNAKWKKTFGQKVIWDIGIEKCYCYWLSYGKW